MRIIITDLDTGEITVECEKNFTEEKGAAFPDIYARIMAALDAITVEMLKKTPAHDRNAFRNHMYDVLDDGFSNFLSKVFPEINVGEFNLSAAAIVYAQDQIIQKADEEGKTYKEMLAEYEAIADEYVKEKQLN